MLVKKSIVYLIALTILFSFIQWYAWVYRWGGADSGTYFYKVESLGYIKTKKIQFVK